MYYSGAVPSDLSSVCERIVMLMDEVQRAEQLSEERLLDLRLVLSELMINGCEHGNRNRRERMIEVELDVQAGTVHFCVRDEGVGLCGVAGRTDGRGSCSGRGLAIVSALCDEVRVEDAAIFGTMVL